jgi:hypothetical protein
MKKIILTISAAILLMGASALLPLGNEAQSSTSGSPNAKTGSPGDNSNCTSCHSGTATTVAGLITSNIPASGYVPGATYTITATITASGINKFGFQISPQNTTGVKKGTMVLTNTLETQLTGSGKYITHKTAGTSGTGSRTWSFDWTAPAAGEGTVTFYGAFNAANGNNASSGDQIFLSSLTVQEDISLVTENYAISSRVNIFPNPVEDVLYITSDIAARDVKNVQLLSIEGKVIRKIDFEATGELRIQADVSSLAAGNYFVCITTDKAIATKKIIKH